MKNPLKFIQDVKQEAFKVTWPTGKETLQGALMVVAMAIIRAPCNVSLSSYGCCNGYNCIFILLVTGSSFEVLFRINS